MRHDVSMLPAKELSSVVVKTHAVLPFARFGHQSHGSRVESKIASEPDGFCRGIGRIADVPGETVHQAMNLIVQPPGQTPEDAFRLRSARAVAPAREDHLLLISYAIAVGVFAIEQIRSRPH